VLQLGGSVFYFVRLATAEEKDTVCLRTGVPLERGGLKAERFYVAKRYGEMLTTRAEKGTANEWMQRGKLEIKEDLIPQKPIEVRAMSEKTKRFRVGAMDGNLPQPRALLPHAYSTRIANTIPYLPTRARVSAANYQWDSRSSL